MKRVQVLVCVDTETTGLSTDNDHITQLAACTVPSASVDDDGTQLEIETPKEQSFMRYVQTRRRIPDFVSKLTGITQDMALAAPPFTQVWQEFRTWLVEIAKQQVFLTTPQAVANCKSKGWTKVQHTRVEICLAAHNGARFDFPVIFSTLLRHGMNLEAFAFDDLRVDLACAGDAAHAISIAITGLADSLPVFKQRFPKNPVSKPKYNATHDDGTKSSDKGGDKGDKGGDKGGDDSSVDGFYPHRSYKLELVHKHVVGRGILNAHNALADVYAMRSIIMRAPPDSTKGKSKGLQPAAAAVNVTAAGAGARASATPFGTAPATPFGAAPATPFGAAPAAIFGAAPAAPFGATAAVPFGAVPVPDAHPGVATSSLWADVWKFGQLPAAAWCQFSERREAKARLRQPRATTSTTQGTSSAALDAPAAPFGAAPSGGVGTVCITRTGKKYHRAQCTWANKGNPAHQQNVAVVDARAMGLAPCRVCSPP